MNFFANYLDRPFPYFKKRKLVVFITTAWIFVIFAVLESLGFARFLGLGFATAYYSVAAILSSSIVTYLFPLIFKKFFRPEKWTIGKLLLFSLFICGWMLLCAFLFFYFFCDPHFLFQRPMSIVFISFACCFVPTLSIYFIEEKGELNRRLDEKNENLSFLAENNKNEVENKIAMIVLGKKNDRLILKPENFLYAEVIQNYITLYYLKADQVEQKIIRTTLSQLIEQLDDFPRIIRCHRAFIVNTGKIINITGNSRGYLLDIENVKHPIPTSRSYVGIIQDLFSQ